MLKKCRVLLSGILALFMTLSLIGCGSSNKAQPGGTAPTATKPAEPAKILVYGSGADPRGLDPAFVDDGESAKVMGNVYEGLLRYKDGSSDLEPCLATEWTPSKDGLEWTFKLRQGVKFHDGAPFNAQAVKVSIDRQLPPKRTDDMPYASFTFGPVKEVVAVDEYTVKFVLTEPYAPFLANLAMSLAAPIVSPKALNDKVDLMANPVGTGPYKFVKWVKGQEIDLDINADYWGEKPKTSKVVFKITKENSVRASELITGAIDIMDGVDPNDVKKLKDSGMTVIQQPGMNVNYMLFNCSRKPMDNPKIREAISSAINRQNLVDYLYQGLATIANGPLPSFMMGYAKDIHPYGFDPEKAKKLLSEAGYPNGLKLKMITYSNPRPYNPVGGDKLAAAIQADLLKVGVTVDITSYPWTEYRKEMVKGDCDLFFQGFIGDNGDPDNFLTLFETKEIKSNMNGCKYSNKEYDDLIAQARKVADPAERAKIYVKAQEILLKDAPWVFISNSMDMVAYNPKVQGYKLHPTGLVRLAPVSK